MALQPIVLGLALSDLYARLDAVRAAADTISTKQDAFDLAGLLSSVSQRALQTDFVALTATVNGKASTASVTALQTALGSKANQSSVDSLATSVASLTTGLGGKAAQSDLASLTQLVNMKATQAAVDALSALVATKIDATQLGSIKPIFRVAPGTTIVQAKAAGDTNWTSLFDYALLQGPAGLNPEIGVDPANQTSLRWRLGTGLWSPLFDLALLKGKDGRDGGLYSYHHPGIGTSYFTLDAPEVSTAASKELVAAGVVTSDQGDAYRLAGQGRLRSRERYPVETGQIYQVRYAFTRVTAVDPSGDSIAVGVLCYGASGAPLQELSIQSWNAPAPGTLADVTFFISRAETPSAPEGAIRLPAGTVAVSTYLRTYGGDQDTRVRVVAFDMQGINSGAVSTAQLAAYTADAKGFANAANTSAVSAASAAAAQGYATLAQFISEGTVGTVRTVTADGNNNGIWRKTSATTAIRESSDTPSATATRLSGAEALLGLTRPTSLIFAQTDFHDLIGPVAEPNSENDRVVPYAADVADEMKFTGLRIAAETALRKIYGPDWLGKGWQDVVLAPTFLSNTFEVAEYRQAGAQFVLDEASTTGDYLLASPTQLGAPSGMAIAEMSRGRAFEEAVALDRIKSIIANGTPVSPNTPANGVGPQVISQDAARWGTFGPQQIPSIAITRGPKGMRHWMANYGSVDKPLGGHGEQAPCNVRLMYSDDAFETRKFALAYTYPVGATDIGVIDPFLLALPGGRLLVMAPVVAPAGLRSTRAFTVENATTGSTGAFETGDDCFLDFGFCNKPALFGSDVMFCASQPVIGVTPPYAETDGIKVNRLRFFGKKIICEQIGKVPFLSPEKQNYAEASIERIAPGLLRLIHRTEAGPYYTSISSDWGRTWPMPTPLTGVKTVTSRACMIRSPSGRLVLAHNASDLDRANLAVTLTGPGEDGGPNTWRHQYIYDSRGGAPPRVSYPDVAFGFNADGRYDGKIYVVSDCGRGRQDAPTYTNELNMEIIDEQSVVDGRPTSIRRTFTN